eukprot:gene32307-39892_t
MTVAVWLALAATSQAHAASFEKTATGVVIRPDQGAAREVRLEVMKDNIIHVVKLDQPGKRLTPSLMTVAAPCACKFTVAEKGQAVTLKAGKISATVSLADGRVQFADSKGKVFLKQAAESIAPVTVGGKPFVAITEGFNHGTGDAYYGLGQHQNGQMNLNGEDVLLAQHNMDVAVPFLVSDKNYGLLWDNNAISRFGDPKPYGPMGRDLKLVDDEGKPGGLTARYYVGGKLVLTRQEKDIAYQYLKDVAENWPRELGNLKDLKDVKVVWDATLSSDKPGVHKMQLYSSDYATLTIDGKQVLDVWRQGWNPWYHNFEVSFAKDKPVKLHLEWKPASGMVAITHNDPLPAAERHSLTMSSEVAEAINYHVISADSIDKVIAGYRHLTGQAPMMPKWTYGYWQSRQRYETQEQLLDVVREHRKRGWPLDAIVQDWFYWPQDGWGTHDFDKARFPDPKAMVDEVHKNNARIMLSIWGKFYANTDNYKEFAAKGHMWTKNVEDGALDWVGPGYKNSHYDPYTQEARDIYYRQLKTKLVDLGFDAWWMDNSEADVLSNSRLEDFKKLIGPTVYGAGEVTFNPYSLVHSQAMIDGLRRDQPDKRQFILSRSGFAGIQRNSVAVWSGDTVARWPAHSPNAVPYISPLAIDNPMLAAGSLLKQRGYNVEVEQRLSGVSLARLPAGTLILADNGGQVDTVLQPKWVAVQYREEDNARRPDSNKRLSPLTEPDPLGARFGVGLSYRNKLRANCDTVNGAAEALPPEDDEDVLEDDEEVDGDTGGADDGNAGDHGNVERDGAVGQLSGQHVHLRHHDAQNVQRARQRGQQKNAAAREALQYQNLPQPRKQQARNQSRLE